MVEFLLIFALGFLAAALIGMLITPAIHGRIVKLTEKRIQATVPLSAAEIKGKSDLMRAGFASETAKLTTQLEKERENLAAREWANNKLQSDLANLAGEKTEADQKIAEFGTQSAELRSEARKQQQLIDRLSGTVTDFERMKRADTEEINRLNNDLMAISTEVESMKIDLATSGTETVSLRSEINSLEDQRQQLQTDIKAIADTAHDLQEEHKLEQERHNNSRIELAATQSTLADAEMQLGHANEEIEALQQVNRELQDEAKAIAETAHELQQAYNLEQEAHDNTRSELTAKHSALVEHQAMLVQSTERIEEQLEQLQAVTETEQQGVEALKEAGQKIETLTGELESTQAALEKSRGTQAEIEEAFSLERKNHKTARRELAAREATLSKRQTALEQLTEKNEAQLQQLRGLTETERQGAKALKKAEQQIGTLTGKLKTTQTALEKSRLTEAEIEQALGLERKDHKNAQLELAAMETAMAERQASLEQSTEQQILTLTEKLQNTRAALEKSQDTVAGLKDRIAGLNASEKQRLKDASIAADRLKDLEVSLHEEQNNGEQPAIEHGDAPSENNRHNKGQQSAERNGGELEVQVDALKDALKKSKEMSGEFRQQLKKMRREVHQLHRTGPVNGNDRADDDRATADEGPEPEVANNGIGRAMQSDHALKTGVEELRARQQALMSELNSGNTEEDDRLREEIADIAALAVGLSAHRGGRLSPVHALISEPGDAAPKTSGRKSLAERAREQVEH